MYGGNSTLLCYEYNDIIDGQLISILLNVHVCDAILL